MSHFSGDEWVDFTRGVAPPEKAEAMQASLDGQCAECTSSLRMWSAVRDVLSRELQYRPPREAVEAVRDAYPSETPWNWAIAAVEYATVIFDSWLAPSPVGVRSSRSRSRQITVEAEPFIIDLQMESDSSRYGVMLTGQILGSGKSSAKVGDAEVILLTPDNVLQKTRANEFGEFCFDLSRDRNLRLFINMHGERAIGIVVPDLENGDGRTTRRSE